MVMRRALGEALPNQGHFFNDGDLTKRLVPAGPDHAQVAACAGMADYVDALFASIGERPLGPAKRARAVHDAMRAREEVLLQPLLEFLLGRNDVRLIGPRDARDRAPTVGVLAERPGEELAAALAPMGIMAGGGDFLRGPTSAGHGH